MRDFDITVSANGECSISQRGSNAGATRRCATGGAMASWIEAFAGDPADVEFELRVGAGASEGIVDDLLVALEDDGYRTPRPLGAASHGRLLTRQ